MTRNYRSMLTRTHLIKSFSMMGKWLMISLKAKQVGLQGKILLCSIF